MQLVLTIAILIATTVAHAEVKIEAVEYKQGGQTLEGFVAYDTKNAAKRPGIVVVPDWMGVSENAKDRAKQLAELGFTAFVADIYGKGNLPKDGKQAGELATKYKSDRPLLRKRAIAALEQLRKQKTVDGSKIAAIGYCFGGTTALELGRAGQDLKGIVSFHGALNTPTPQDAKKIKGKVLVLHGADDPFVPAEEVKAFEEEMRAGNVDWELVKYSKAVHSFTIKDAGNDNSKGAAYNAEADRRSWVAMKNFFSEIF